MTGGKDLLAAGALVALGYAVRLIVEKIQWKVRGLHACDDESIVVRCCNSTSLSVLATLRASSLVGHHLPHWPTSLIKWSLWCVAWACFYPTSMLEYIKNNTLRVLQQAGER